MADRFLRELERAAAQGDPDTIRLLCWAKRRTEQQPSKPDLAALRATFEKFRMAACEAGEQIHQTFSVIANTISEAFANMQDFEQALKTTESVFKDGKAALEDDSTPEFVQCPNCGYQTHWPMPPVCDGCGKDPYSV